jgi:cbb3-type cytochrome oxidase subunit 3
LGEFYGWLAFLAILVILFVGIALFLFPRGKRARDLDRSLTEAVEEWRSKGREDKGEDAPAAEGEKAKAPNP